ncbi:TniQ family protein [Mesorhizobium sp. BHbsci]
MSAEVNSPGFAVEIRERYRDAVRDRWPVTIDPQPDELLSSWLHRLAIANGIAPRPFAGVLGLGGGLRFAGSMSRLPRRACRPRSGRLDPAALLRALRLRSAQGSEGLGEDGGTAPGTLDRRHLSGGIRGQDKSCSKSCAKSERIVNSMLLSGLRSEVLAIGILQAFDVPRPKCRCRSG